MRAPDPGIEQAQVIVDLGNGAHCGAGIVAGGLLVNGDGRREPFDIINIRFIHLPKELPGIGGQ
jgi:hypothetical protein